MLGLVELYLCGASKCVKLTPLGLRIGEKLHELLGLLEEHGLAEPLPGNGAGIANRKIVEE
jgi:hypothetical protein